MAMQSAGMTSHLCLSINKIPNQCNLPPLVSVASVTALRRNDLTQYFEGYYPGATLPDIADRRSLVLLAIGYQSAF